MQSTPIQLDVTLKYASEAEFASGFAAFLGSATLFLRTRTPRDVGTVVNVQLLLRDGRVVIEGRGRVLWVYREGSTPPDRCAGMGIAFEPSNRKTATILASVVNRLGAGRFAVAPGASLANRLGLPPVPGEQRSPSPPTGPEIPKQHEAFGSDRPPSVPGLTRQDLGVDVASAFDAICTEPTITRQQGGSSGRAAAAPPEAPMTVALAPPLGQITQTSAMPLHTTLAGLPVPPADPLAPFRSSVLPPPMTGTPPAAVPSAPRQPSPLPLAQASSPVRPAVPEEIDPDHLRAPSSTSVAIPELNATGWVTGGPFVKPWPAERFSWPRQGTKRPLSNTPAQINAEQWAELERALTSVEFPTSTDHVIWGTLDRDATFSSLPKPMADDTAEDSWSSVATTAENRPAPAVPDLDEETARVFSTSGEYRVPFADQEEPPADPENAVHDTQLMIADELGEEHDGGNGWAEEFTDGGATVPTPTTGTRAPYVAPDIVSTEARVFASTETGASPEQVETPAPVDLDPAPAPLQQETAPSDLGTPEQSVAAAGTPEAVFEETTDLELQAGPATEADRESSPQPDSPPEKTDPAIDPTPPPRSLAEIAAVEVTDPAIDPTPPPRSLAEIAAVEVTDPAIDPTPPPRSLAEIAAVEVTDPAIDPTPPPRSLAEIVAEEADQESASDPIAGIARAQTTPSTPIAELTDPMTDPTPPPGALTDLEQEELDDLMDAPPTVEQPLESGLPTPAARSPRSGEESTPGAAREQKAEVLLPDTAVALTAPVGITLPGGRLRILLEKGTRHPFHFKRTLTVPRDKTVLDLDLRQGSSPVATDNPVLASLQVEDHRGRLHGRRIFLVQIGVEPDGLLMVTVRNAAGDLVLEQLIATLDATETGHARMALMKPPEEVPETRHKVGLLGMFKKRLLGK